MSSPLPYARITSPLQLVRPLSEEVDDSHVSKTSKTLPQAIMPSRSALHYLRANSFTHSTSTPTSTSAEFLPQLSERDSIFATHYLLTESAATTPRLQPTQRGKHNLHQDVAANLELSKPLPSPASKPPLLSYKTRSSSSIASLNSNTQSSYWQTKFTSTSTPTSPNEPSVLLEYSVEASHKSGVANLTSATNSQLSPQYPRTRSYGALSHLRMSETWNQPLATDRTNTGGEEETSGIGIEKASTDRKKRSSSRDTVEKRIEATLANEKPVSNARSRKASHYLRLFKENTDALEQKKVKDKSRDVSSNEDGIDRTSYNPGIRENDTDDGEGTVNRATAVSDASRASFDEGFNDGQAVRHKPQTNATETKQGVGKAPRDKRPVRLLSEVSIQSNSDEGNTLLDSSGEKQNIEWRSSSLSEHGIPFRLLEEIRNYPRKPVFPKEYRHLYGIQSRDNSSRDTDTFREDDRLEPTGNELESNEKHVDLDGEEYESNKEHISSAIYYPHQAASPDSSDTNLEQIESADDIENAIQQPNFRLSDLDTVVEETQLPTDEVTIALQSQDEHQCFHGDLPQAQVLSSPDQVKQSEMPTSSASDTDYESWDEIAQSVRGEDFGVINEGEATPTANPNTLKQVLSFKKRHRAPLGAVELKPYKHQVGGHSTVFHFSKRAVCKQLSNRENEFYEVLERRHPELLKFLPRYVNLVYAQRSLIAEHQQDPDRCFRFIYTYIWKRLC